MPAVEFLTPASAHMFAELLAADDLPVSDLSQLPAADCLIANIDGQIAGAVALQIAGSDALLRSLVVAPAQRGRQLGGQLVERIEALARRRGVSALYLLTTTAEAFFSRRGYRVAERGQAPDGIRATAEFSSLCPASSAFLYKRLD